MTCLQCAKIVMIACFIGVSILSAQVRVDSTPTPAGSATTSTSRPYLDKPSGATQEEWQKLSIALTDKYKLPQQLRHNVVVLRAADNWSVRASDTWSTVDAIPAGVHFSNAPKTGGVQQWLKHSPSGGFAMVRLWIEPNVSAALGQCVIMSARQLGDATRPSTWHGKVKPLSITGWDFVAHVNDAPSNRLFASAGNVWVSVQVAGEEEVSKHATLAEIAELCEKLSLLMDSTSRGDEASRSAIEDQLSLKMVERGDGKAVLAWDTPKKGKLDKYWVKMITSNGKLSITGEGKVEWAGIAANGATVTCYAISPDGKEWYSASVEIPGQPASQPATKPNE